MYIASKKGFYLVPQELPHQTRHVGRPIQTATAGPGLFYCEGTVLTQKFPGDPDFPCPKSSLGHAGFHVWRMAWLGNGQRENSTTERGFVAAHDVDAAVFFFWHSTQTEYAIFVNSTQRFTDSIAAWCRPTWLGFCWLTSRGESESYVARLGCRRKSQTLASPRKFTSTGQLLLRNRGKMVSRLVAVVQPWRPSI